jgi:hypothetical protein
MKARTLLVAVLVFFGLVTGVARADSVGPITFEPPTYVPGDINGQDGWTSLGPYDHVVATQNLYSSFGTQSLRISNAITSGSFADQTFSKQLVNEAGETSAQGDGISGPRQRFFDAAWKFASADPSGEQPGLQVVASPDRGDGARMSWVQMMDAPAGLEVNFFDYQDRAPYGSFLGDPKGCGPEDDFVESNVASGLKRHVTHSLRVTMKFKDGPRNDVVKVYVDGELEHTGTSWEDYFRYCEGNPTRTVDSILFRTAGVPAPATIGKGFLIDRFSLFSGAGPGHRDEDDHEGDEGDDDDDGRHVVVSPTDMKGWGFAEETPTGSGMMVHGPGAPPAGDGSAQLQVDSTGGWILAKAAYQGTYLRDVTKLTYWTYRQFGAPPFAIALQFNVDRDLTDIDETYQGRIVYEPYYTHAVLPGAWQRWNTQDDALLGNWWFTRAPQNTPGTGCAISDPCTWSEVLAKFPNVGVHRTFGAVVLKAGGGWLGGFVGNTDALVVGVSGSNTVYDFEPDDNDDEDDDDNDDGDHNEGHNHGHGHGQFED